MRCEASHGRGARGRAPRVAKKSEHASKPSGYISTIRYVGHAFEISTSCQMAGDSAFERSRRVVRSVLRSCQPAEATRRLRRSALWVSGRRATDQQCNDVANLISHFSVMKCADACLSTIVCTTVELECSCKLYAARRARAYREGVRHGPPPARRQCTVSHAARRMLRLLSCNSLPGTGHL